mgnify:CR=1 FL=1
MKGEKVFSVKRRSVVYSARQPTPVGRLVAGALQDHDRALIVGETTFGKALVQSVYRVAQGAGAVVVAVLVVSCPCAIALAFPLATQAVGGRR